MDIYRKHIETALGVSFRCIQVEIKENKNMKDLTHLLGKKFKTGHTPPREARVICVDVNNPHYPVIVGIIMGDGYEDVYTYTKELKHLFNQKSDYDLTEVTPYDDFKIDDKVLVWDDRDGCKLRAYFAGVSTDGKPMVFPSGSTKWSYRGIKNIWDNCIKFEEDKQA